MTTWKNIPGFGGHYAASCEGRIKAKARVVRKTTRYGGVMDQFYKERGLRPYLDRDGYEKVHIGVDGQKFNVGVHRLVAMAFWGVPEAGMQCCHNDGDNRNNRPENLRWDNQYNNNQDRKRHGNYPTGIDHPMSKFSLELIEKIKGGAVSVGEAHAMGVSRTHYYRLKRAGE